jgi:hypothetical protein
VTIVYDHYFNLNEWIVIILLIIGIALVWRCRKRFSVIDLLIYVLYSVFVSIQLDHAISIEPFDYYDVHDSSSYQLIDFLTYLMYGPFGFFYIYIYDYFKIKFAYAPIYILLWSIVSVITELLFNNVGVFHYKNGYKIYYSFLIYLIIFSIFIFLYNFLTNNKTNN